MERHTDKPIGQQSRGEQTLKWMGVVQIFFALAILVGGWRSAANGLLVSISALIIIITGAYLSWKLPARIQLKTSRLIGEQRKASLHLLSLYRHDVLNQVQLIKGYMQMKKFDRLQSPVQKLVEDAQRQAQLSNLPGSELAYWLTVRDLSAPLVHLQLAWSESRFQFASEADWLMMLEALLQAGEQAAQTNATTVMWQAVIQEDVQQVLIQLAVLGHHVNDAYIKELMAQFSLLGWKVDYIGEEATQYQIALRQAR